MDNILAIRIDGVFLSKQMLSIKQIILYLDYETRNHQIKHIYTPRFKYLLQYIIIYLVNMDLTNQQLIHKFNTSGVLLMLDAPKNMELGIDNITWAIGPKFKGIKLIPLGTHIINYTLSSQKNMFPIHHFINFTNQSFKDPNRIQVFRWSDKDHRFMKLSGEQAQGYREGVRCLHFDPFLGPYPVENTEFWKSNSKYITKEVLEKLDPKEYFSNFGEQYGETIQSQVCKMNIDSEDEDNEQDAATHEDQLIKQNEEPSQNHKDQKQEEKNTQKTKDFGANIYYSEIPRRLNSEAHHTSIVNIDKTEVLDKVIQKQWKNKEIYLLGEIQYSFLCFLIGQCLDSYTQWKQLIMLLVFSEGAFRNRKQLMQQFIIVLYDQLKQFPEDFFYDELGKDNFLCRCFSRLQEYTREDSISKKIKSRIKKLFEMLNNRFKYSPEEDEEESPVVVEENESYF